MLKSRQREFVQRTHRIYSNQLPAHPGRTLDPTRLQLCTILRRTHSYYHKTVQSKCDPMARQHFTSPPGCCRQTPTYQHATIEHAHCTHSYYDETVQPECDAMARRLFTAPPGCCRQIPHLKCTHSPLGITFAHVKVGAMHTYRTRGFGSMSHA